MNGIRYANIGVGVGTAIVLVGIFVFRHASEAALQAVAMLGLIVGLGVYLFLDERAMRRHDKRSQ